MKIYSYHPTTGAFLCEAVADYYDLQPDVPVIPAWATPVPPPATADGQIAVFSGEAWSVVDLPAEPAAGAPPELEPVELTFEERLKALQGAVQLHLDVTAKSFGYDDIASAVSYADEPAVPQFQLEGQALRAWRSLVWAACYELLGQVQREEREEPTMPELIAALPGFLPPVSPEASE
ncbi:hypothetical protein D3C86_888390 [compost metagenome]